MRINLQTLLLTFVVIAVVGCDNAKAPSATHISDSAPRATLAPTIALSGCRISFPPGDSSLRVMEFGRAEYRNVQITTSAPARVILTTVQASSTSGRMSVPVFETSDLTQLYTDYTKARQDLVRLQHEQERVRDLYEHNAVAGKELTQAESDEAMAQATLAGLESRLLTAGLSPAELSKLRPDVSVMIANVPETDISSVQLGEDVQIEFDSWRGQILHGRVLDIGHAVDPTTRTFNVRIELANHERLLRPGMFARASFGVDVMRRFVVPENAVVSVEGKNFVFVTLDGHSFERREVTLGPQSNGNFVILSGLSDQEQVVTNGAILLKGLSFGS